jgi:hypothetical protein
MKLKTCKILKVMKNNQREISMISMEVLQKMTKSMVMKIVINMEKKISRN